MHTSAESKALGYDAASSSIEQGLSNPSAFASTAETDRYQGVCPTTGNVVTERSSTNTGDIEIPVGETLVIANMTFTEVGNFVVDGGTLIVENATLKGHSNSVYKPVVNWILQDGGCMEVSNTKDYVLDDLWVGGNAGWQDTSLDSSRLFVENSLVAISAFITSSNETVKVDDSIWQGFIDFTPFGPQNLDHVWISNSVIRNIGISVGNGPPPSQQTNLSLTNLNPGHFPFWDLNSNESSFQVPYDLTLSNATLIPANADHPCYLCEGFGWSILLAPYFNQQWPTVQISDSQLTSLEPNWAVSESATFSHIPAAGVRISREVLFSAITLTNVSVDSYLSTSFINSTVSYIDSASIGLWASGYKDNVTLVNSTSIDFNPWECQECTFIFSNSTIGIPSPLPVQDIPDYEKLPNATNFWGVATGYGSIINSSVTFEGNVTFYPGSCCLGDIVHPNSTVDRIYPVLVLGPGETKSINSRVVLESASGVPLESASTNDEGWAYLSVSYNSKNWTNRLTLAYNTTGGPRCARTFQPTSGSTLFFASTPLVLTCASTESSSSSGGSGVPGFPFQLYAVVSSTVVVVTSYLVVKRRRQS